MAAPTIIRPQAVYVGTTINADALLDLAGNVEIRYTPEVLIKEPPTWIPPGAAKGKEFAEIRIPFYITSRMDTETKDIPWSNILKTLPLETTETWSGTAAPYTFESAEYDITQNPSNNTTTLYIVEGGYARKYTNCKVSSLTISKEAGQYLRCEATILGLYDSIAEQSTLPGLTTLPNHVSLDMTHNTGSFGEGYVFHTASLTINPTLAERPAPDAAPYITDWRATGVEIVIESDIEADASAWETKIKNSIGSTVTFDFNWGSIDIGGSKTVSTKLKGVLESYDEADREGIRVWSYRLRVVWDDTAKIFLKIA